MHKQKLKLPGAVYAKFYHRNNYKGKPAIFVDRDGVLVEEVNYLCRKEDVAFIQGAADAISEFNREGIPVIMVTNQAGIGRGYFDWKAFEEVQEEIISTLGRRGAFLCCTCPPVSRRGRG